MILIKNSQRKIKINTNHIKKIIQEILNILNYDDFDISVVFTTNKTIQKYNKKYRQKDQPTDILSFAYHADLKPGQRIKVTNDEDKNLGDLIISPEYVLNDAPNYNQNFDERLKVILVHGICHLLGYDHIDDKDYKIMYTLETEILLKLDD